MTSELVSQQSFRLRDCKAVLIPVRTKSDKPYRLQKFKLSVDFFNQVNILYDTLTEFCTPLTCPTMTAGTKQRKFKVIIEFVAHASMNQMCELLAGKQVDTPLEALKSIVDKGSQKDFHSRRLTIARLFAFLECPQHAN
ncbi:hypothetical protein SSX86_032568 [Deinandra increscens subsp. villosa]|uniref:Uncharacterized protein n=1 Tax=Deinandra increscens subsp. villosa TaxID=3103831 RepID=A0AAP0C2R4_9ASTR